MKKQVIYLMLFFVMVLWTSGIMVAKTIGDSMGALEFSFWRWAVAVIFMAPFFFTHFSPDFTERVDFRGPKKT